MLIAESVLLLVGLTLLYFGAEFLVAGASKIAMSLGVSPMIVGLTIVAFATSAPEFVVSILAALDGSPDIALGNVVGSNIANLALIIGLSAIIFPIAVNRIVLGRDYPIMLLATALAALFAFMGDSIERFEGLILLAVLAGFLTICVRAAMAENRAFRHSGAQRAVEDTPHYGKETLKCVAGLVGLVVGAQLMVSSASNIARYFHVSELAIGATVVAFGTSAPELATSIVAALRKEADIGLGNIIGSNIFNLCFILGGVSLLHPIAVAPAARQFDIPVMAGVSVLLLPIMLIHRRIDRRAGIVLLTCYVGFVIATYLT